MNFNNFDDAYNIIENFFDEMRELNLPPKQIKHFKTYGSSDDEQSNPKNNFRQSTNNSSNSNFGFNDGKFFPNSLEITNIIGNNNRKIVKKKAYGIKAFLTSKKTQKNEVVKTISNK